MTRETKIGLLVGLAFIIVIGILLSDHFASTVQPPPAPLSVTADNLLKGAATPGADRKSAQELPIREVTPDRVLPVFSGLHSDGRAEISVGPGRRPQRTGAENNSSTGSPLAGRTDQQNTTRAQSTDLQPPPGEEGRAAGIDSDSSIATQATSEYVAEPGDTLSRMADRLLGRNTAANRQAIIRLNPSLQKDANRVVAGQKYLIPVVTAQTGTASGHAAIADSSEVATRPTGGESTYVTKPGDTLWRIAVDQCGSSRAVEQIRQLNRDVLKNGDRIQPNMRLRLPPRVVAVAE